MSNIGGNITGRIQTQKTTKNRIYEDVAEWQDAFSVKGWLGFQGGDQKYSTYKAKVEESTHCFLCDFHPGIYALASQNTRMIIKGFIYNVLLIDNPDEMDEQLEISLRRVGAENG